MREVKSLKHDAHIVHTAQPPFRNCHEVAFFSCPCPLPLARLKCHWKAACHCRVDEKDHCNDVFFHRHYISAFLFSFSLFFSPCSMYFVDSPPLARPATHGPIATRSQSNFSHTRGPRALCRAGRRGVQKKKKKRLERQNVPLPDARKCLGCQAVSNRRWTCLTSQRSVRRRHDKV